MPLSISKLELDCVTWAHQVSQCDRAESASVNNSGFCMPPPVINARGVSSLYGVTPLGDELDLRVHWRARGETNRTIGHGYVYSNPTLDPDVPGLVSLRQSVVIVDDLNRPLIGNARTQAILASLRHCDWAFAARQCLPVDPKPRTPPPAMERSGPGCSFSPLRTTQ